jgi:hypothetical protein
MDGPSPQPEARLPRLALPNDTFVPNRAPDSRRASPNGALSTGDPPIICREPLYLFLNEMLAGRICRNSSRRLASAHRAANAPYLIGNCRREPAGYLQRRSQPL